MRLVCVLLLLACCGWGRPKDSWPKGIAMQCRFDMWERTPYGAIRYTHMICRKKDGTEEAWMRVSDHSVSLRRFSTEEAGGKP